LVLYALTSEKAAAAIERENKVTFIVDAKATKPELKKEIEKNYGQKIRKITVMNTPQGRKKAIVSFATAGAALDLAAKLKVI